MTTTKDLEIPQRITVLKHLDGHDIDAAILHPSRGGGH